MNQTTPEAVTTTPGEGEGAPAAPGLTLEERRERERQVRISEHAYYLAMARGFSPGRELDDWLAAEKAVDQGDVASGS